MKKFRNGATVRLVENPIDYEDGPGIAEGMRKYFGRTVTINYSLASGDYRLKEDHRYYFWDERWFESVDSRKMVPTPSNDSEKEKEAELNSVSTFEESSNQDIFYTRDLITSLVNKVINDGGKVTISKEDGNILFNANKDTFSAECIFKMTTPIAKANASSATPCKTSTLSPCLKTRTTPCTVANKPIPHFIPTY